MSGSDVWAAFERSKALMDLDNGHAVALLCTRETAVDFTTAFTTAKEPLVHIATAKLQSVGTLKVPSTPMKVSLYIFQRMGTEIERTFPKLAPVLHCLDPRADGRSGRKYDALVQSCAGHQRPLELSRLIVRHYSAHKEVVLSLYAGTGTDIIAALDEGRDCIAFEPNAIVRMAAEARLKQYRDFHGLRSLKMSPVLKMETLAQAKKLADRQKVLKDASKSRDDDAPPDAEELDISAVLASEDVIFGDPHSVITEAVPGYEPDEEEEVSRRSSSCVAT